MQRACLEASIDIIIQVAYYDSFGMDSLGLEYLDSALISGFAQRIWMLIVGNLLIRLSIRYAN